MAAKRIPLYLQTLIGIAAGVGVGLLFPGHTARFGVVGRTVIALIKMFATPLLFFAVLESWIQARFRARGLLLMLAVSFFDSLIAIGFSLSINHFLQPGRYWHIPKDIPAATSAFTSVTRVDWVEGLFANVPDSLVGPFLNQSIPGVILIAVFLGIGINALKRDREEYARTGIDFDRVVHAGFALSSRVLEWILYLVPYAVLAAVAQSVGSQGFAAFRGMAVFLGVALLGMALQIALVYQGWIALFSRVGLRRFWREAKEPVIYGAGVNSSLATLPLTLRSLDRMGVSPTAARLSACIGTNFNNDGILLYEATAVLFIAQAYGISLSWHQQLTACLICLVVAFGIAGVPEAGVIGLALVLGNVGVPNEVLPLLLTVDWIIARCRSATNVISDLTVATVLDRFGVEPSGLAG